MKPRAVRMILAHAYMRTIHEREAEGKRKTRERERERERESPIAFRFALAEVADRIPTPVSSPVPRFVPLANFHALSYVSRDNCFPPPDVQASVRSAMLKFLPGLGRDMDASLASCDKHSSGARGEMQRGERKRKTEIIVMIPWLPWLSLRGFVWSPSRQPIRNRPRTY